ncbi:hypothetical protein CL618_01995 [archaeon]|nr:hypothetical protein [archaeon]|tara:strand:+ start:1206 stop:1898 length:693 start_codon:yes stop_codon:yes gene_type:complete
MKILVGCPTSNHKEYCLDQYISSIKSLTYKNDILLIDNSENKDYYKKIKEKGIPVIKDKYRETARDRIIHSRNILRRLVLDNGYDYLFSLEQDVIPPKDVIERLLSHKKDIISGVYYKKIYITVKDKEYTKIVPLLWKITKEDKEKKLMTYITDEELQTSLLNIDMCGLGCLLIHRNVLEKVKFRYEKQEKSFDDTWFCKDAIKNNFKIYTDPTLKCKHLTEGMDWNIKQ